MEREATLVAITANRIANMQRLLIAPVVFAACTAAASVAGQLPGPQAVPEIEDSTSTMLQANKGPGKDHANARFPRELTGLWIGSQYRCPLPEEGFDGEEIMDISPEELVGYEEIYKPTEVTLISEAPKIWKIETLVDIGPSGVFQEYGAITFRLHSGILTTDHKPQVTEFRECRQQ